MPIASGLSTLQETFTLSSQMSVGFGKGMNLFLNSQTSELSNSIPLTTFGAAQSGLFRGFDLFVEGDYRASGYMNLFLAGPGYATISGNMNLWIGGENATLSNNIPLYLANNQSGVTLTMPLYISGEGILPGYYPASGNMNMFMARIPSSAITLFTKGPGTEASGNITMFIRGLDVLSSGMNLSIPNIVGFTNNSIKTFIHGGG